ncbi:MAG TPA: sigma-54 dependent transcriptional regulator [Methylocella sp.]|nr:sigma-54 dependent transcriptional regulator [Methylocella sp.]
MSARILIADDDEVQRHLLEGLCHRFGYHTEAAASGEAVLARLPPQGGGSFDLLMLDLTLPSLDAMAVLERLIEEANMIQVIMLASPASVDRALAAVRAGAYDFLVKPAAPERLQVAIKNALAAGRAAAEIRFLDRRSCGTLGFGELGFGGEAMARAISQGEKAAKTALPILLEGEPGTGKESFARAIHGASARRGRPFAAVNCAGPPDCIEEKLLRGREEAQGGTLFLDRICELPFRAQGDLLSLLHGGLSSAAQGKRAMKPDMRVILGADRNLIERVTQGAFREDLFYRINVCPIFLPPLRARQGEVATLAAQFCARFAALEGKRLRGICAEARALLESYEWPGNLQQLENAIFRAVALAEGDELTVAEFPQIAARTPGFDVRIPPAPPSPAKLTPVATEYVRVEVRDADALALLDRQGEMRELAALEAEAIGFALEHYRRQMSEVARKLGIGRSTLYRKLKEYQLDGDPQVPAQRRLTAQG